MDDAQLLVADQMALARLQAVQPRLVGLQLAAEAIALEPYRLLHAGPPMGAIDQMAKPIYHAAIAAILFEGWAVSVEAAQQLIAAGPITFQPAQDRQVVTPLAAVVSPSMQLQVVSATLADGSTLTAYSPINGGPAPALRLGMPDWTVVERLRWVHGVVAPALASVLDPPIDLLPLAEQCLLAGEDCHGMTATGSARLGAIAQERCQTETDADLMQWIGQTPTFFLNLWMAACKSMMLAASGVPGSSVVTAIGGNGRDFGLQLSGLPLPWFTVPAQPPSATWQALSHPQGCGAIGDSAVVDGVGFGGMAIAHAVNVAVALPDAFPHDAAERPLLLLPRQHAGFTALPLRVGLVARAAVEHQTTPLISLAILDGAGERGMVGKGVYSPPLELFQQAVAALGR